jgi:hypothetical protein
VATVLRNGNYRSFPSSQKALLSSCSGRYLPTAMYFPELFIPGRPEVNQSSSCLFSHLLVQKKPSLFKALRVYHKIVNIIKISNE